MEYFLDGWPMANRKSKSTSTEPRSGFVRWILIITVAANLFIIGLIGFSLSQSWLQNEDHAKITTQNLSRVFAGDVTDVIGKIDLTVFMMAEEIEKDLAAGGVELPTLNAFIARSQTRQLDMDNVGVINAQGKWVYGIDIVSGAHANITNQPGYLRLRNNSQTGLVVFQPVLDGKSKQWAIICARRINLPDGSFAGIVYKSLTLNRLVKTFSTLNVGAKGALALRDEELNLIARIPEPKDFGAFIGKMNASPELQAAVQVQKGAGTFHSLAFDKTERIYSYCKVADYPLYAVAGLAEEEYRAAWWNRAVYELTLMLVFFIGSLLSARIIYRYWLNIISAGQELARQKEALANERALLRTLVDHLPVCVYIKDKAARKTLANPDELRTLGINSEAEVIGKMDSDFYPPVEAAGFYAKDQQVIQTGLPLLNYEEKITRSDGSTRWILTSKVPLTDSAGKVTGLAGIGLDITERKMMEAALRESEDRLRFALDEIETGAWELDLVDHSAYRSLKHDQIFGYETLLPKWTYEMFLEHIVPEDRARVDQKFQEAIKTKGDWHFECRIMRRDGEERWIMGKGRHRFDSTGQPRRIAGIVQDITQRKQLEEQLRRSQKLEVVGQLAGGVAHDFNNILAVIQLQAGQLKADQSLSEEQRGFARDIDRATDRAANLTRQLLQFSRKQALRQSDLDLCEVVNSVSKMLGRILGGQIQMQVKCSAEPLFVHADEGMLEQVLMNLTVNARDAMPRGGQLVIETAAVSFDVNTARQSVQARPGAFACLSVTDTGCGIPPDVMPKIFEPFFTTKEVGKGSGLGLSAVLGIVQEHRGWVNVYSEAGRGTAFRIYLPLLDRPSDHKPVAALPAAISTGEETILLVEDDDDVRASLRTTLRLLGYQVLEAVTGAEALQVWKQHHARIHLVLTDLMMPGGMNGLELARQLLQKNPKLKVVYASGYSAGISSQDPDLTLQEGVNFIAKPFDSQKLAKILRHCLDG